MDATDDDADIRLQKVAADLTDDFDSSLVPFLYRRAPKKGSVDVSDSGTAGRPRVVRARVRVCEAERMAGLLNPFQECPQLLDGHLARWLPLLAEAFLASVEEGVVAGTAGAVERGGGGDARAGALDTLTCSLQEAVAQLLYTLTKVRGDKVVVSFLPVDTRHLEPLLGALEGQVAWKKTCTGTGEIAEDAWSWQERYVVLLWLAQLLLAPFDLATISTGEEENEDEGANEDSDNVDEKTPGFVWPTQRLPSIATRVLPLGLRYLAAPGKERDGARAVLVRLAMRRDMQQLGVRRALVDWALGVLGRDLVTHTPYYYIGTLAFLAGLLAAAAGSSDMDGELGAVAAAVHAVAGSSDEAAAEATTPAQQALFARIRASAVARKMMIKAVRAIAVRTIEQAGNSDESDESDEGVERAIGYLLERLGDNDTPVRFAASKALGVITLRLAPELAAQVVSAVLGGLEANVLYVRDTAEADLTAVDPLAWHGLMLTLAHLLYRRAPPAAELGAVAAALLRGLEFERRSAAGSATGTNVRDAACFGLWSLARRYTTAELQPHSPTRLATHLVVAATLDPAGNIRRGSAAALQELVGRHPDTVPCGIALVQAVDYHAVALRARATRVVAARAARRAPWLYGAALRDGLFGWRGLADAADAGARRIAAASFGHLARLLAGLGDGRDVEEEEGDEEGVAGEQDGNNVVPLPQTVGLLCARLHALEPRQAEERHGLLLALSAVLDAFPDLAVTSPATASAVAGRILTQLHTLLLACQSAAMAGPSATTAARRPELLAEAASRLIISSFPIVQAVVLLDDGGTRGLMAGPALVAAVPPVFAETVAVLDAAAAGAHSQERLDGVRSFAALAMTCLSRDGGPVAWLARQEPEVTIAASDAALVLLAMLAPSPDGDARGDLIATWAEAVRQSRASARPVRGAGPGTTAGTGAAGSGYVFALAKAWSFADATGAEPSLIAQALLDRWTADRAVDTRVALLQALAQSPAVLTQGTTTTTRFRAVLATGLDDYTTDARGDIGSHVRLQALRATQVLWAASAGQSVATRIVGDSLFLRVLRLAAEKLDRVRVAAKSTLEQALGGGGNDDDGDNNHDSLATVSRRLQAQTSSSQAYFTELLSLLDVVATTMEALPWMAALMRGYVTSADTGNEDLVIASRAALVAYVAGKDAPDRARLVWRALLSNLPGGRAAAAVGQRTTVPPDRVVVPTLEVLAFLFYAGVFGGRLGAADRAALARSTYLASRKTGSLRKLEACVKVYGALATDAATGAEDGASEARQQLAALLQHPWPRVRTAVVDELWALGLRTGRETEHTALKGVDWAAAEKVAVADVAARLGLT